MSTVTVFCGISNGIYLRGGGPDAPKLSYGLNEIDADLWEEIEDRTDIFADLIALGLIAANEEPE